MYPIEDARGPCTVIFWKFVSIMFAINTLFTKFKCWILTHVKITHKVVFFKFCQVGDAQVSLSLMPKVDLLLPWLWLCNLFISVTRSAASKDKPLLWCCNSSCCICAVVTSIVKALCSFVHGVSTLVWYDSERLSNNIIIIQRYKTFSSIDAFY